MASLHVGIYVNRFSFGFSGLKKSIGDWAKATALDHNQRQLENLNEELPKSWSFSLADYLVFQKVNNILFTEPDFQTINGCR